jgi:toxin FitB
VLVDTNVLCEPMRPRPDRGVAAWLAALGELEVSVITVEEVLFGLSVRPAPRLERVFLRLLEESCTVLPVTRAIGERAGRLRGLLARQGSVRTQADLLIAATALEHRLVLATRNVKDFRGCGLDLVNPFA